MDVIVVGAGFAGIYSLHKLRSLGFSVKLLEAGEDVGGTWYWNRYPGARCDLRSLSYSYSFDEELEQEWRWTEHYASQAEIEKYINHVVDRFDLRKDMAFGKKVTSSKFDETSSIWLTRTEGGEEFSAQYLVLATGGYSVPVECPVPGAESFEGELYYTARWPHHGVDFGRKRVGVIGSGSSGAQVISQLSAEDVAHLFAFHRTSNFAVPSHNGPMDPEYEKMFKANYREFRALQNGKSTSEHLGGIGNLYPHLAADGPVGPVAGLSDKEFEARMREAWPFGGPAVVSGLTDIYTSESANERIAEYLRNYVRQTVNDPSLAETLCAKGYFLGTRRILATAGYYEAFNRENVTLVDVKDAPITRIVAEGIETTESTYDLDIIVCATGFDSATGSFVQAGLQGTKGAGLDKAWANGPSTYLGIFVHGFPNMFMITGPGSPGIRSHVLVSIEQHVEWVADLLTYARSADVRSIEASVDAESSWTGYVADVASASLLSRFDSQYVGANIPGKPRVYTSYLGGTLLYRRICDSVAAAGYEGLQLTTSTGARMKNSATWSGLPDSSSAASSVL